MAEIFKFFNSAPGDERWHYASDFADYFGGVLSNGILHTDKQIDLGLRVRVVPNTLTTKVAVGKAIIKGYAYENTTDLTLKHDIPEPTLKRIDRIVLRLDLSNSSRFVKLFVKKGTSSSTPIAPTLQRDQYIYELSLAQVLVRENTTQLIETDLKDERMIESLCGLVSSIISVPTTQFQEQWDAWFKSVQDEGFAPYTDTGFKENLKTTDKTTLVNAINEVFTSGNNVKKNVVDTLLSLDNTLPINTNSTWDKITASLPNVSGKSPMNVYIQPTEPVKKEGIWFKTAESNKPDVEDYKYTSNVNSLNNSITKVANPLYYTGGLVLHENNLFHIYSMSSNSIYVNKYDTKTALWSVVTTFTESTGSLSSQSACVIDDTLYFVSDVKGRINTLNLKTNTRSYIQLAGSTDWRARKLCAVGDVIYGFGDNLGNGYNNRLASYNVKTGKFSILADNTSNYLISSAHFYNGKLLCGQETYQDPKFYNISSNTWSNGLEMPVNNYKGLSFVATSNAEFYSFGGIEGSYSNLTSSYVFNELQNVWSLAGTSPVGRDLSVCLGPEGNSIYTLGSHKANNFTENEFHRINYNHNIIKGVNIENSSKIYDASLLAVKAYPNLTSITNNVTTAYISKDGKSKLRGIPTYVGAGSSWQLTNIK